MVSEVLSALAEVALGTGDLLRAAELAVQAREPAVELAMQHEEGLALRVLGRVRLAEANLAAARKYMQSALAIFQAMANSYEAARYPLPPGPGRAGRRVPGRSSRSARPSPGDVHHARRPGTTRCWQNGSSSSTQAIGQCTQSAAQSSLRGKPDRIC